jgi:hypothetical protein
MVCVKHKVETFLRCGKCDTPICPDCMVASPAGTRCRDCASLRGSPLFEVRSDRLAVSLIVGLTVATIGGFILASAGTFGFLLLWASLFYGGIVGEAVLRTVHRKRGIKVEVTAGACALLGALMGLAAWMQTQGLPLTQFATLLGSRPFFLIAVGIGVFAAVSRVRFI